MAQIVHTNRNTESTSCCIMDVKLLGKNVVQKKIIIKTKTNKTTLNIHLVSLHDPHTLEALLGPGLGPAPSRLTAT